MSALLDLLNGESVEVYKLLNETNLTYTQLLSCNRIETYEETKWRLKRFDWKSSTTMAKLR